jgi:hypothetical protein
MILMTPEKVLAQEKVEFAVFPGYHLINSDKVATDPDIFQTDWVFGGNIAVRFRINNIPLAYSIGYSQGKSTILKTGFSSETDPSYSLDLRYRTLPQEILLVNSISDRIELLTGINVTAQDRTLQYSNLNIKDDRLFSMGIGLSGKINLMLNSFSSDKGIVFMNLSARWTEFIYHDAKNRNLDDFTLRHVTLSPQIGVSYSIN